MLHRDSEIELAVQLEYKQDAKSKSMKLSPTKPREANTVFMINGETRSKQELERI